MLSLDMSRPRKQRKCACPDRAHFSAVFKPVGASPNDMDVVHLAQDELETLHLCDGEGMTQEEAGVCMGVSRGTVQRLLASARCKVAKALVGQKTLAISSDLNSPSLVLKDHDKIFEQLRDAAYQQNQSAEFPARLLAEVVSIADNSELYTDKSSLVELLINQINNFDTYAGTGCFDTSVSANTIQTTIRRITA